MDNLKKQIRQAELEIESNKARLNFQKSVLKEELLSSKGVAYLLFGAFSLGYFILSKKGVKNLIAANTPVTVGSFLLKNIRTLLPLIL